jgi:hypothetical protein
VARQAPGGLGAVSGGAAAGRAPCYGKLGKRHRLAQRTRVASCLPQIFGTAPMLVETPYTFKAQRQQLKLRGLAASLSSVGSPRCGRLGRL